MTPPVRTKGYLEPEQPADRLKRLYCQCERANPVAAPPRPGNFEDDPVDPPTCLKCGRIYSPTRRWLS